MSLWLQFSKLFHTVANSYCMAPASQRLDLSLKRGVEPEVCLIWRHGERSHFEEEEREIVSCGQAQGDAGKDAVSRW